MGGILVKKRILSMALMPRNDRGVCTACGPSESASSGSTASGTGQTSSGEEKDFEGTITINTQAGPGADAAWQAVADAYMEKHPDVEVVIDLKPTGQLRRVDSKHVRYRKPHG